jgi:hypothetical protein
MFVLVLSCNGPFFFLVFVVIAIYHHHSEKSQLSSILDSFTCSNCHYRHCHRLLRHTLPPRHCGRQHGVIITIRILAEDGIAQLAPKEVVVKTPTGDTYTGSVVDHALDHAHPHRRHHPYLPPPPLAHLNHFYRRHYNHQYYQRQLLTAIRRNKPHTHAPLRGSQVHYHTYQPTLASSSV